MRLMREANSIGTRGIVAAPRPLNTCRSMAACAEPGCQAPALRAGGCLGHMSEADFVGYLAAPPGTGDPIDATGSSHVPNHRLHRLVERLLDHDRRLKRSVVLAGATITGDVVFE